MDNAALDFDREHLWHPYTSMRDPLPVYPVASASGVRLTLTDGRTLIDGMASWWCAIHGYRHPALDAAVRDQLERMAHVMFGGLTHEPAIELGRLLVQLTGQPHVFFCDSGSVSVEVAIKIALQYWQAQGRTDKRRLLALRGGYHGDTFGAMAACDPVSGMHQLFRGVLAEHLFAPVPSCRFGDDWDDAAIADFERLIGAHAGELAAVILEPIVQGAGGMRFHSPACLRHLRALCDEFGLLLVLDEIATGFGRTGGELFACAHAGVVPDVMTVGKALTGGVMTLAATLCTGAVAEAISSGEGGALMHGPTFMANPLACAAALASTGLLLDGGWRDDVARISAGLTAGLEPARELPGVADVRVLGAIGVVQLDHPVDMAAATRAAVDRGVWLRPFRDLVYAMPPYVCSDDEVAAIAGAIVAATGATAP
jgi:adenosylmethionine-8-amino-7-oxononanoate aminotransferase